MSYKKDYKLFATVFLIITDLLLHACVPLYLLYDDVRFNGVPKIKHVIVNINFVAKNPCSAHNPCCNRLTGKASCISPYWTALKLVCEVFTNDSLVSFVRISCTPKKCGIISVKPAEINTTVIQPALGDGQGSSQEASAWRI